MLSPNFSNLLLSGMIESETALPNGHLAKQRQEIFEKMLDMGKRLF